MTIDPSILLAARILGVLVFGTAVVGKLRHREEFIGVVANYRLLPESLVRIAAWLVIALELLVVLSLSSGMAQKGGAALAVFLLSAFAVAMTINLARGRKEIDCGCFQSSLRQKLSVGLIVRNVLLSGALVPLLEGEIESLSVLQVLDGCAAGIVVFVLYQAYGQLSALEDAAEATRKRFA
jgi:uncharacterized membrane protein YphA (DoxX/SURF4 family)